MTHLHVELARPVSVLGGAVLWIIGIFEQKPLTRESAGCVAGRLQWCPDAEMDIPLNHFDCGCDLCIGVDFDEPAPTVWSVVDADEGELLFEAGFFPAELSEWDDEDTKVLKVLRSLCEARGGSLERRDVDFSPVR